MNTATGQREEWMERAAKFLAELPRPLAWLSSDSLPAPEPQLPEFGGYHPTAAN
jgi:hypothetical protein